MLEVVRDVVVYIFYILDRFDFREVIVFLGRDK